MKAKLLMAMHFHQPVGNFDNVIEGICDRCYIPFLETAEEYPDIEMSFHFTGSLLEWLESHRPEVIEMIRKMVRGGRVEMIGGAFFEPILTAIPARDALSQIRFMDKYINEKFSSHPKGAWVAERVWEPELPSTLHDAEVKYIILDDTHFMYSGMQKEQLYGYYMTEDNCKPVAVFPTDKVLRYSIPFRMPMDSIEYMRNITQKAGGKSPLFIYGDDAEKFGEWPGTYQWVYGEGWLKKFFDGIMSAGDWLETMTFSQCLDTTAPSGEVYLPSSSYSEMLEWALPSSAQEKYEDMMEEIRSEGKEERYKPYIRGGLWRNFLTKYPESGHMHKKMMYVSRKLEELRKEATADDKIFQQAELDLYRGQCNCAYWHGVFGGLYLFHLRKAIYEHLIKSECAMDSLRHGKSDFCEAKLLDMDADGLDEVILENRDMALYIDPSDGGVVKEIDSKKVCHNFMNVLSRRHEAYHRRIIKKIEETENRSLHECETIHDAIQVADPAIKDNIIYDRYVKYGMIDHFLSPDTSMEDLYRSNYREEGDFIGQRYDVELTGGKSRAELVLSRKGIIGLGHVFLKKEISFPGKGTFFTVNYTIKNLSDDDMDIVFAPEFNVTMPDADSPEYTVGTDTAEPFGIKEKKDLCPVMALRFSRKEGGDVFHAEFSEECGLWYFPVETVSQSEVAYELNYQCSTFIPVCKMSIPRGKDKSFSIKISIDI